MTRLVEHARIKKAKREHQCNWCNQGIEIGTSYVRQRLVDVRDAWVVKLHPECDEAFTFLPHHDREECFGIDFQRGCCCESTSKREGCNGDCDVAQAGGLKKHGQCFNCKKWVDEMDYCYGCKHWICEACELSQGTHGGHGHDPSAHLTPPPEGSDE